MSETQDHEAAATPAAIKPALISLGWSRQSYVAVFLALAAVLFVALNVLSNSTFRSVRADLTDNDLFTLSQGTINTLKKLREPIVLRMFYSAHLANEVPQIRTYAKRVEDLLREYAARSGGRLVLEIIDPKPFSEQEDLAVSSGMRGAQTQTGAGFYFGVAGTNSIGRSEKIAFLSMDRQPYLEYDLTELVHNLHTLKKPTLGIVTNLPLDTGRGGLGMAMRGQSKSFLIYDQLRQRYQTRFLEQDFDQVPEGVDVLMVAHPKKLTPATHYAIDQFVLRGGRALVFVDPYSEVSNAPGPMGMPVRGKTDSSDLGPLLEHWGVNYDPEAIIGDRGAAARVRSSVGAGAPTAFYVLWVALDAKRLSDKDPVTAELELLQLSTPGHLEKAKDGKLAFEPLIHSTDDAKTFSRFDVQRNLEPQKLLLGFVPEKREFVIAARLSGKIATAFPAGPPQGAARNKPADAAKTKAMNAKAKELGVDVKKEQPLPAHQAISKGPVNIIVMADSDIFDDRFWVRERNFLGQRVAVPTANNADFVINAVDNLMGSGDLISLRTRASDERPFTVVQDIRKKAEQRYLEKEKDLQKKLRDAEQRLRQLRGQEPGAGDKAQGVPQLSPDERREVTRYTKEYLKIRKDLRAVQRSLVVDIDALGARLAFINIALVPLLVAVGAIGLAVMRRRRRAGRARATN